MKTLFGIVLLASFLYGGEIGIMEEVVDDISKLKADYKTCQDDLKNRFIKTNYKELEKYKILLKKEKKKNADMLKDMEWYTQTIEKLENSLNITKAELLELKQKKKVAKKLEKVRFFRASTFRLKESTSIYDKVNGIKINNWVKNKTFTSNVRTDNWIKITGYFKSGKWQKADTDMWIRADKVFQRK